MKSKYNFLIKILVIVLSLIINLFKCVIWINSQIKKLIKVTHKFIEENLIYFTFLNTLIVTIFYIKQLS